MHSTRFPDHLGMAEIFISHEILAFDADGYVVGRAEAEDRRSAEVAGMTMILEDGAFKCEIRRTRDNEIVAWHNRCAEFGVRRISVFKD